MTKMEKRVTQEYKIDIKGDLSIWLDRLDSRGWIVRLDGLDRLDRLDRLDGRVGPDGSETYVTFFEQFGLSQSYTILASAFSLTQTS